MKHEHVKKETRDEIFKGPIPYNLHKKEQTKEKERENYIFVRNSWSPWSQYACLTEAR